jgi:hypothetical protein
VFVSQRSYKSRVLCVGLGVCAAQACMRGPVEPAGPLHAVGRKTAGQAGLTYGYSVAHANAVQYGSGGEVVATQSGNAGGLGVPLFPERANLRLAPVSWMDFGGHLGWVDSSLNVRVGAPVGSTSVPWTLLASYQTDRFGIIQGTGDARLGWNEGEESGETRADFYPTLWQANGNVGRLVLGIGASYGRRYYELGWAYHNRDAWSAELTREEWRAQMAFGIDVAYPRGYFRVAALPHFVVASRNERGCSDCELNPIPFGALFAVSFGLRFGHDPRIHKHP